MTTRRHFLEQSLSALALLAIPCSGCKRVRTREQVLGALAEEIVAPSIRALSEVDARLVRALEALPETPSPAQLDAARKVLSEAILAWERAYVFRTGPLVESNAFLRAKFWPVRASSFNSLLQADSALDAASVAALGVDVRGLYALERLLWERPASEQNQLLFTRYPQRARSLAVALAKDVQLRAASAEQLLDKGEGFARKFAAGGQENLALLVTQLVQSVEAIFTDRFERVLGLAKNQRLKQGDLPGDFAGISTQIACASLAQIQRIYSGAHDDDGLCALVAPVAPGIDAHVQGALTRANASAAAIGGPLEQVVRRDPAKIERARDDAKALEMALKVELTSALGITLNLTAGDGD